MQVTLALGTQVIERHIPQRSTTSAIGERIADGDDLELVITEDGSGVEAWLYLGSRAESERTFERTAADGEITVTDAELDLVCPAGSSIDYEVWTGIGTAGRLRAYGRLTRAKSLEAATQNLVFDGELLVFNPD